MKKTSMKLQSHEKSLWVQWNTPLLIGDYIINNSQSQLSWLDGVMIDVIGDECNEFRYDTSNTIHNYLIPVYSKSSIC